MPPVRPPFDPEVAAGVPPGMVDGSLSKAMPPDAAVRLAAMRVAGDQAAEAEKNAILCDPTLEVEEVFIPGPGGDIRLSVIRPRDAVSDNMKKRPAIYNIHPGAMVMGNEFTAISSAVSWMKEFGGIVASVDYRLAPEHPGLAPFEDSWEGLVWFAKEAGRFGFDPDKLILSGFSAGGGIAAAVAIKARDEGSPKLCAQILVCPMLDDRAITVSHQQYFHHGSYTGEADEFSYGMVLGDMRGTDDVSVFVAPARATDLSGLPPTYIEVGSAEPFRDSVVAYASKLWEHGVQAELMVFAGGLHGFDFYAPEAMVSKDAIQARLNWIRRFMAQSK
ncbi:Carboxylesterase NlhH [Trichoderma ghanense]|uniref:Carboxylesterase NlhH n=1 Tax=Trichoderma ghanense TaxID=65468 RepID=A0ABY2H0B5_9HYPO